MTERMSANTQAILMLTAPLMLGKAKGKSSTSAALLKPREYQRLARHLLEIGHQPADLLSPTAEDVIDACRKLVEGGRLRALLGRGFLLSQAVERWQSRAIWVVSRADAAYPRVLKAKLKVRAPAVLYGCGEIELLGAGGLAVVGSRHVSDELVTYTEEVGSLAARDGCTVISGGARGVDRAAMDGALRTGGRVVGVLAEELEREAMHRKNRDALRSRHLVLVSEYDPCSRFSVGHAMQRNKLIYAFADHSLVVNSDLEKGGTWAGAVEQLDKLHFTPVFVRSTGTLNRALDALLDRGAHPWPNPSTPDKLIEQLSKAATCLPEPSAEAKAAPPQPTSVCLSPTAGANGLETPTESPAEALFRTVQDVVLPVLGDPKTENEIADLLRVTKSQAREWLHRMVEQGLVRRSTRPILYSRARQPDLTRTGS